MTRFIPPAIVFVLLFALYHAAEYAYLFRQSVPGFLIFMGLFFAGNAWYIEKQDEGKWAAWGLALRPFGRNLVRGLILGLGYSTLAFLLSRSLGLVRVIGIPPLGQMAGQCALLSFGVLLSSFSEDMLTRCLIYRYFRQTFGFQGIVLFSAIVYVFNHIYRLGDGWLLWSHLFVLGILLAIPLMRTGNAGATLGIHWGMNIVYQLVNHVMQTQDSNGEFSALHVLLAAELLMIPATLYLFSSEPDRSTAVR